MEDRVCAIIVTYNSAQYIKACLESVLRQTYAPHNVIVVDNNSSDNSVESARDLGVHVIENKENVGFAAANNQGACYALDVLGCDFLMLINPDTVSDERLIESLVGTLKSGEDVGIAQAKIFLMNERELINASGIHHHYLYFGYCEGYRQPDVWGQDREIAVASGACLMVKARVLKSLDYLFNEDFFMYHEDTDLCLRARLAGYRVMLSSGAVVWHDYRFGSGKKKFFHMEKNRLFLMFQNYRLMTLVLLVPAIMFTEAQVLLHSLMGGWFAYKLKSYLWLLVNIRSVFEKRASVQKNRKTNDLDLMRLFVTDISFESVDNPGLRYVTNPALRAYYRFVTWMLGFAGVDGTSAHN